MVDQIQNLNTNEKFKDTAAGKIPADWGTFKLEVYGSQDYRAMGKRQKISKDRPVIGINNKAEITDDNIDAYLYVCPEPVDVDMKYLKLYLENCLRQIKQANCDRVYSIKANLKTLVIPHPPMEEQVKIADALYTIDRLIDLSHRKIETLKELKKVLGHELFRGKKRFNKPETEKEGAIPPPDKSGGLLTHFL